MMVRLIFLIFTICFWAGGAQAQQCPGGYFRIGPLDSSVTIASIPSNVSGNLCVRIETTEELATFDSLALVNLNGTQAVANALIANVRGTTKNCHFWMAKHFDLTVTNAAFSDSWGQMQLVVNGTVTPCVTGRTSEFTVRIPARVIVSGQRVLTLALDDPRFESGGIQGAVIQELVQPVISKVFVKARDYLRVFRFDLTRLVPKDIFLFNPEVGQATASLSGDTLSARVPLSGRLTSIVATKWVRDRLPPSFNSGF